MSSPRLSFLIPVRNDASRLARCLQSITDHRPPFAVEVIVADNGSTDESAAVARRFGAKVLDLPDRPVAVVRNEAAATAQGDLLAFVDADHELAPGWSDAAVEALADPSAWAAGAPYHPPPNGTWVQAMYDRLREHRIGRRTVDWLASGNLVVRRSAFESLGGFDVTLESCEDVDFCRRIREAGGAVVETDRLHSIHHGDPATLRALFFSELWRGRDNLRVSLRERVTLRSLPSIVSPLLHLLAWATVTGGVIVALRGGSSGWMIAGAALSASLITARAIRLAARVPGPRRLQEFPHAWLVAAIYEIARALALVARASHDVRRRR